VSDDEKGEAAPPCKTPEDWAKHLLFRVCATHNDLLSGNILARKKDDSVIFIDYEYGCYNYAGFDIANHFNEYAGFDCNFEKWYPKRDAQLDFMKVYLKQKGVLPAGFPPELLKPGNEQSAAFDDALILWLNLFAYLDHFFWGLWGVCQAYFSIVDFDYLEYAEMRLGGGLQFAKKAKLPAPSKKPPNLRAPKSDEKPKDDEGP